MKNKAVIYTEIAYIVGLVAIAVGVMFMTKSDFGVSMVVAPAYVLYLKISQYLTFFTFGMAEYTFQAVLLLIMIPLVRRFKLSYLFSFVTAVLYGFILDGAMFVGDLIPQGGIVLRIVWFAVGMLFCALGVSMMFHTYISPEVYELFVKEVSAKYKLNINRFKTGYDIISALIGIILSFCFFGLWHFEGVKAGTVVCALVNGFMISRFSKLFEHFFEFKDGLKLRKYF